MLFNVCVWRLDTSRHIIINYYKCHFRIRMHRALFFEYIFHINESVFLIKYFYDEVISHTPNVLLLRNSKINFTFVFLCIDSGTDKVHSFLRIDVPDLINFYFYLIPELILYYSILLKLKYIKFMRSFKYYFLY